MDYRFPFGNPLKRLVQQDRSPKEVFVLGVYASAVHARWVNGSSVVCQALAVASEPCIFWDGNVEEAQRIIDQIVMPPEVGKLALPNRSLNGPSARVLEEHILAPLGLKRSQAWLCDLLPETRLNPNQLRVITEKYDPLIERYGLNPITVPPESGDFCDGKRCLEITAEIMESKAKKLILLGDIPIRQYLHSVCNIDFASLREYTNRYGYGSPAKVEIGQKVITVIPIAHPRQIGGLGRSNSFWAEQHQEWEKIVRSQ